MFEAGRQHNKTGRVFQGQDDPAAETLSELQVDKLDTVGSTSLTGHYTLELKLGYWGWAFTSRSERKALVLWRSILSLGGPSISKSKLGRVAKINCGGCNLLSSEQSAGIGQRSRNLRNVPCFSWFPIWTRRHLTECHGMSR